MWQEISRIGKKLVQGGLVESHFGNISVRKGDKMLITRSGSSLDELGADKIVEVDVYGTCALDVIASSETKVHRAIYNNTSAIAIVHAHCPYAVTMSLLQGDGYITPLDSEGQHFLGNIPIVQGSMGSEELARNLAKVLAHNKAAIVYGHGTFAIGRVLDEAYVFTTQIEHSCRIKYLYDLMHK
ncbi:MAG: aldolase [Methanomethylovorans sp.]|jgi:L-fuculose-phosphate aldolase|nr:aldolase [Methanomethylovorans sp.]